MKKSQNKIVLQENLFSHLNALFIVILKPQKQIKISTYQSIVVMLLCLIGFNMINNKSDQVEI